MLKETTKTDLAEHLYPDMVFDLALPQSWVNHCISLGFDPRSCVVWGYPKGNLLGVPLPLTAAAEEQLQKVKGLAPLYR